MNSRKADGGFTLPEVAVAILVISAMMVGVFDAHKAMLISQKSAREIASTANQQAVAVSLAQSRVDHVFPNPAQSQISLEVAQPSNVGARGRNPVTLIPKRSNPTVKTWTLRVGEDAVFTLAQQVNTSPSCAFDAIARRCRA